MRHGTRFLTTLWLTAACMATPSAAGADWVEFQDQTATRLIAPPGLGVGDAEEKSYAWGDLDRDDDVDLVVARKEPWSTPGKRVGVLLLNDDGVLTDHTWQFAGASTVPTDLGFRTPTNTRDVILVDVNLDGWLDVVTATTTSPTDPQWIAYPRVYRNRGCAGGCGGTADWLGLIHEPERIPTMQNKNGGGGYNPCFSHVDAGDVNGDGYPDLWFINFDTPPPTCAGSADFNNKLLLNLGAVSPGYFVDVTEAAFTNYFQDSLDGTSGGIQDFDGDGAPDLYKQNGGTVAIAYQKPPGMFGVTSTPYTGAAYYASTGDLNHDGRLDLVVGDDGMDRYLLNHGATSGVASFITFAYSFAHSGSGGAASDDGFAGDSLVADLNHDGWNDVLITDIDIDISGCDRRMHVYRNLGGSPGGNVVLQEQTSGSGCATSADNPPSCLVAGIPADRLEGVHDVAVFDINGDGWNDLVVGRCSSTEVYINQPPGGLPAGGIDADSGRGSQLQLAKGGTTALILSWGDSCVTSDTDYAVYRGQLGAIGTHAPETCSTGGATSQSVPTPAENAYFLVVPRNDAVEGSYGMTSSGAQRPAGFPVCLPQYLAGCE